ncbi:MAG: NAD(P)/FAD-dependent oxidoreductase [Winogradskyella sp.]|uniref:NAD(P)/FAD-dependent oxidoreductase n=1 Tax=Winogradskyella sp. TaxID=1883156 RepID=UPI000F3E9127|nr:NAD(P)/FAD-dependent oxidoreductase [Winogradskyella sp.]RNC88106.1 MAG: NAD(P)/FAD-dependent oxidoreductase [Winogradskyella sp.]
MHKTKTDVVIIGGGLAGLTSAIHLSKHGFYVALIEKNTYPKHKVCGEYVSNEVLPYLKFLGFNPFDYGAKHISEFQLTTHNNKTIKAKLPLGGFGISRYTLDFELYKLALGHGIEVMTDTVLDVSFSDNSFTIQTKSNHNLESEIVIGAFGKRSTLDVKFQRKFIKKKSPYLGVKTHVSGNFPEDTVALHNFKGGYCGVSKVENDHINLCYITSYKSFKKYKSIEAFQDAVMFQNKDLKTIFQSTIQEFDKPLTISQISFETKSPVENHMLMCGDSAGMIHPLCGNGMGMAIRGAQLASKVIIDYLEGKITSREQMETLYKKQWQQTFGFRLKVGHTIAFLFRQDWLAPRLLTFLKWFPFLVPRIIKMTHGKPMQL